MLTDRDGRVEFVGNPFSASDAQVANRVIDFANRQLIRYRPDFTTGPGDTERKPYQLVVAFNVRVTVRADWICADSAPASGG